MKTFINRKATLFTAISEGYLYFPESIVCFGFGVCVGGGRRAGVKSLTAECGESSENSYLLMIG